MNSSTSGSPNVVDARAWTAHINATIMDRWEHFQNETKALGKTPYVKDFLYHFNKNWGPKLGTQVDSKYFYTVWNSQAKKNSSSAPSRAQGLDASDRISPT